MGDGDGKDSAQTSIHWFEKELLLRCGISKERFHKVRGDQWEKGYAAESCRALTGQAFSKGVHRIYAECDPDNESSQ